MEHHTAERATTRPVVSGTQGVVAAGHPLVAMAGMRMLLAGGNAFDAAAAANAWPCSTTRGAARRAP
jgi:Gamma-glutamyltransferase